MLAHIDRENVKHDVLAFGGFLSWGSKTPNPIEISTITAQSNSCEDFMHHTLKWHLKLSGNL
jgi:hypothetical protein